jgi:hypothetical protein
MPTDPIGEIPVEITGDLGPLEKALQDAKNLASEWAGRIAEGFNSGIEGISETGKQFEDGIKEWIEHPLDNAAGAVRGFVESIGPMGVAMAAGAAGVAFLGKEITDLVLEEGKAAEITSNLADQLNLSFNDMRKLSDMADVAGVNIGGLARVSMMLADALEDSEGRGKKVANALAEMGVSATDSGDALLQVLQKLSEIPDATERIAKAHEIMGRSAIALEPLIKDYTHLKETIEELGGALDKDAIEKLKAADDAADKLGKSWRNFKEDIAVTFSPQVTAGLNLLSSILNHTPGKLGEELGKNIKQMFDEAGASIAEATKRSKEYNDELAKSNEFNVKAGHDMKIAADAALKRSEEYNKELDASNKLGEAAAEKSKKHAAALAKEAEAYRVLMLSFQGVDDKLQGIKAIKFEQQLFPPSWFKEMREFLIMEDKAIEEATKFQMKMEGQRDIKLVPFDVKIIENLTNAWKMLGNAGSAALNDTLTKGLNAYNEAIKTSLFTTHDLAVLYNQILNDQLKLAEANAGTKDLQTRLNLEMKIAEVTGASAQKQIEGLENIRLHTESLNIATHALGDVYVGLNESFLKVFDNLDKGLTKLITSGGSITDTLKSVGKSLEQDIVGTFVHGITEGLKKSFIDSGVGQAVSGFLTKVFGDVFGGLFKAASQAPGVVAQTANTTALTANTTAITALTSALGAQSASSAAANSAASAAGGGGGVAGGLGSVASGITAISSAVSAITGVLSYLQQRRMEQDIGRIEVTTRGMLNQLISLQGTFNDYLPQLNHLVDIWAEIMVTNDILRLMAQNGVGVGSGNGSGSDGTGDNAITNKDFGQEIADTINNNPSNISDGYSELSSSLAVQKQAADDYSNALQTTASNAYSLDSAVTATTSSLQALNDATKQGAIPALVESEVVPAIADSISQNPQFMQGAMLPHVNNPIQYGSIAPVVGGPGVTRGGAQPMVSIYAVDPNGRQLAQATQKGLEEIGVRIR